MGKATKPKMPEFRPGAQASYDLAEVVAGLAGILETSKAESTPIEGIDLWSGVTRIESRLEQLGTTGNYVNATAAFTPRLASAIRAVGETIVEIREKTARKWAVDGWSLKPAGIVTAWPVRLRGAEQVLREWVDEAVSLGEPRPRKLCVAAYGFGASSEPEPIPLFRENVERMVQAIKNLAPGEYLNNRELGALCDPPIAGETVRKQYRDALIAEGVEPMKGHGKGWCKAWP